MSGGEEGHTHQDMLINDPGEPQTLWLQAIQRVHGHASTGESESLHVPSLGSPQTYDAFPGQHVQ